MIEDLKAELDRLADENKRLRQAINDAAGSSVKSNGPF